MLGIANFSCSEHCAERASLFHFIRVRFMLALTIYPRCFVASER
jgi:hypothetical protein